MQTTQEKKKLSKKHWQWTIPRIKLYAVKEGAHLAPQSILSPIDAVKFLTPLSFASEEYFVSLHLNAKLDILGVHEVSHGTISSALVHPREVFKAALLTNSHSLMVCHNHPSGAQIKPSPEDFETTKQLIEAGHLLGIAVLDHLIVGLNQTHQKGKGRAIPLSTNVFSFRQNHPELWLECA